jgi:hypothetical protein
MKQVLGIEKVRKEIICAFYPKIKNKRFIRTFDAFQQYDSEPYTDKEDEIFAFCRSILDLPKYVVFTASNIQKDEYDEETHYQTYIVNNPDKTVHVINPARDVTTENAYGIYEPEITYAVIQPFFEYNDYKVKYIELENPAQSTTEDVFCQTWSLYILLEVLQKGPHIVAIPKSQSSKYRILLGFYQLIMKSVPIVAKELARLYKEAIKQHADIIKKDGGIDIKNIKSIDTEKLIMSMKPVEMEA